MNGQPENISKKINEDMHKEDSKIIKDLIVGFLIVRSKVKDGSSYVNTIPLDSSWDGFNGDNDLDANEEIIGVIPAPQGSYKILGLFPCNDDGDDDDDEYPGTYELLGYEYDGAYCPDWKELLEENIKSKARKKIKKLKMEEEK